KETVEGERWRISVVGASSVRDAALDLIYPLLRALSVLRTEVVHPLRRLQLARQRE
ncbi:Uncharacterized protein DAT39_018320, partial [Clarias magur]